MALDQIGLHQQQMSLLASDVSLLHFPLLKIKSFMNQNNTSFNPDKFCHLKMCLHLIDLN